MNKKSSITGNGASSILMIFVVLCFTLLAILSLLSAQADNKLAHKIRTATVEYYTADSLVEEKIAKVENDIYNIIKAAGTDSDIRGAITDYIKNKTDLENIYDDVYRMRTDVGEDRQIIVVAKIPFDNNGYRIEILNRLTFNKGVLETEESTGLNLLQ